MADFAVSEEKNRWLRERLALVGIREEDLVEKFVRSSGKGGQHVNKTSTCVWLKHLPTGIEVKCMAGRSQSLNRFLARRELAERVEALSGMPTRREMEMEKIRKRKVKRKRRAGEKYEKIQPEKGLTGEDAEAQRGKRETSNETQMNAEEAD